MPDRETSNSITNTVVHGGTINQIGTAHFSSKPAPVEPADPWIVLALDSAIWHHIPADRDREPYRQGVTQVMDFLVAARDETSGVLGGDPWQDPEIAPRFLDRLEWLLGDPSTLDLYPAEAALLVLLPFLHRVHDLRSAAEHASLNPASLTPSGRGSFDAFIAEHDMLVKRARLRPDSEPAIGWWLFHRWLARHKDTPLQLPAHTLDETLAPSRIAMLLHGLRRGPDVCNPEHLDRLPADDHVRAPGRQHIRDRRLCLIAALAYGCAIETTALPTVIADHLGIPDPVDPLLLRHTVEQATWGGSHDLPVLRAECQHEAVIEALREYTARVDELLHAIHRTARDRITQPMPALPIRLSSDGVTSREGTYTGSAKFRLGDRVLDLLMGVQLYKDPDSAVRELYQNALDACRYRKARTEYLDRTSMATYGYEGRISLKQGVDEQGRAYLDCHDNGIGMGDAELRGVFSKAGDRFPEQADFRLEQAAWNSLDPPVELFPNSRFGIGVLSYFMLADEIRVTTCRLGLDGVPGPVLEAVIHGPGHLFRTRRVADRGEPGTWVRLYLKQLREWSSVEVLRQLLGIAQFDTTAQDAGGRERWGAGEWSPSQRCETVPWREAPNGVRVIWCEMGGALLVDGLFVTPDTRRGVLTGRGLPGAVVDLSGAYAPESLTVDRTRVLTDVSDLVGGLLADAASALVENARPSFGFEWICQLSALNLRLADIVTSVFVDADRELVVQGRRIRMAETGCTPVDAAVIRLIRPTWENLDDVWLPADHVLLWRLLAYRPSRLVDSLIESCPELAEVGAVVPGKPSDVGVLTTSTARKIRSRPGDLDDSSSLYWGIEWDGRATLADLIRESNRTDIPIAEVVASLQARGLDVPDLATIIRSALAKVPFAQPRPEPR